MASTRARIQGGLYSARERLLCWNERFRRKGPLYRRQDVPLHDGIPEEMASDRMDMSPEVIREYYNAQTEEDKRELQRTFLDNL